MAASNTNTNLQCHCVCYNNGCSQYQYQHAVSISVCNDISCFHQQHQPAVSISVCCKQYATITAASNTHTNLQGLYLCAAKIGSCFQYHHAVSICVCNNVSNKTEADLTTIPETNRGGSHSNPTASLQQSRSNLVTVRMRAA